MASHLIVQFIKGDGQKEPPEVATVPDFVGAVAGMGKETAVGRLHHVLATDLRGVDQAGLFEQFRKAGPHSGGPSHIDGIKERDFPGRSPVGKLHTAQGEEFELAGDPRAELRRSLTHYLASPG